MKRCEPAVELSAPPLHIVRDAARRALEEDLGLAGDVTSQAVLTRAATAKATIRTRTRGRVAGVCVAVEAFAACDPNLAVDVFAPDGSDVSDLDAIAEISGPAHALLAGERVALNFVGRLSGVATLTREYVAAVDGTLARIASTRKTTPGLRALEKYAVCAGGGVAHRAGLDDAILVKDNHVAIAGGVGAALMAVRARAGHMTHVAVEVDDLTQLEEALRYSPDVVMLDNFDIADTANAVRLVGSRCVVEASGGVTLETVRAIAETGVDVISIGALTHSAPSLDVGLDITN